MTHLVAEPQLAGPSASGLPRPRAAAPRLPLPHGLVRTMLWVALGGAAVYVLVPQLGSLRDSVRSLAGVQPVWVLAGLWLVAVRYAMAAMSLQVAVARPIPFGRTLLVQIAGSFVGRLAPEGLGWLVLNQRYLERAGLERATALAGITLKVLAGMLTRLVIAGGVLASSSAASMVRIPDLAGWVIAIGLVGAISAAVIARRFLGGRFPRALAPVVTGARDLAAVLRQPRRAAALLGSTAMLTISYGLVLAASIAAFGIDVPLVDVFAVYLGGTAIASLSPTPGNIGAVEIALTAGLTAIGIPANVAVTSVLLYRLLTFWLPIVPGFIAFRALLDREAL